MGIQMPSSSKRIEKILVLGATKLQVGREIHRAALRNPQSDGGHQT
jgi:ABC-type iron transport system FetAB permease component